MITCRLHASAALLAGAVVAGSLLAAPKASADDDKAGARTYFTDSWNASDTEGDPASCKP